MVDLKGAGYSLEAIVAIATVFIFIFGALNVPPNQEWSSFREQISADDLTYTMQQTGYLDHALSNGETGSVQTAFSTVTERDLEVSGLVSNLPINENSVAFYTLEEDRYTQEFVPVDNDDDCYNDLEEIESRSDPDIPILRSNGSEVRTNKDNTTYLADLDPDTAGGNDKEDYDSLWVDTGTECQFSEAEGPYDIEDIFKWGDEYYDIKWSDNTTTPHTLELYQASQPVEFRNKLQEDVNTVKTFSSVDTVNFTRLDERNYNIVVFRENESLEDVSDNRDIVEDFLQSGSILFLADLDDTYFDSGVGSSDFLSDAGFRHVNVDYESSSYSGGEADGFFPENDAAQDTETYFSGLNGDENDLSIQPSAKVISDTESTIQSGRAVIKADENYNFSQWNRRIDSMDSEDPGTDGAPDSACYSDPRALTEANISFPGSGNLYSIINAELGSSPSDCNNDRAVKIDLDDDGDYTDPNEGPFLNGGTVVVENKEYGINIIPYDAPQCSGNEQGDCVDFLFIGDRSVELIPKRVSFPNLNGERIALTGYEEEYSDDDLNLLASTIYWLRGDQVRFSSGRESASTSTETVSGIENLTYMPYQLNLRWRR